jgi:hypothetical protein
VEADAVLGLLTGESLEKIVRAVCKSYLQGLAWTFAYYVMGNIPIALPGAHAARLELAVAAITIQSP